MMKPKLVSVSKGKILQHKGELNSKIYVIKKGLLRSYSIDQKGKQHTFMFAPEGWTLGDACNEKEPCELFIDAVEDSTFVVLEKDIERDAKPEHFHMMVNRLLSLQRRTIMLLSASALERYEHFEITYPDLLQRVPQRLIASYLGMTPEALSKIKGERARRNKRR